MTLREAMSVVYTVFPNAYMREGIGGELVIDTGMAVKNEILIELPEED